MKIDKSIQVSFYLKPKLCSNAFCSIDFFKEDDAFNPFAKNYVISTIDMELPSSLYDKIVDFSLHNDLALEKTLTFAKLVELDKAFFSFFYDEIDKGTFEFAVSSKKYILQSMFAKVLLETPHSTLVFFLQFVGVRQGKTVKLSSTTTLKHTVQCS